jgi:hypothetical protein
MSIRQNCVAMVSATSRDSGQLREVALGDRPIRPAPSRQTDRQRRQWRPPTAGTGVSRRRSDCRRFWARSPGHARLGSTAPASARQWPRPGGCEHRASHVGQWAARRRRPQPPNVDRQGAQTGKIDRAICPTGTAAQGDWPARVSGASARGARCRHPHAFYRSGGCRLCVCAP